MSTLAERIRAGREKWVKSGGYEFQIRRPTDLQMVAWRNDTNEAFLSKVVVGWKIKEHEVVAGGGGEIAEFEPEGFIEWVGDRPAIAAELVHKVIEEYNGHVNARDTQQKK
jgi:hypothetical protein